MNSTPTSDEIRVRLIAVRARMEAAAARSNRDIEDIKLIAVTKTHPATAVRQALGGGVIELGENRVQEAESKIAASGNDVARWHLIGHLQSNKVRRAAQLFDVIHSIDSIELAVKLDRACAELQRAPLPILIQVDLAHEATKSGIVEQELPPLIDAIKQCHELRLIGLMTLPPFFDDAELTRPFFVKLKKLRDECRARDAFGDGAGELSMGMTNDFEVAIEEGATMVRVGTAIFGERQTK